MVNFYLNRNKFLKIVKFFCVFVEGNSIKNKMEKMCACIFPQSHLDILLGTSGKELNLTAIKSHLQIPLKGNSTNCPLVSK